MAINVFEEDLQRIRDRIEAISIPARLKDNLYNWMRRISKTAEVTGFSNEYETLSKYADWVINYPWDKYTQDNLDLGHIKQVLDKNHFGLDRVKQMILDYMAVQRLKQMKNSSDLIHIPPMLFVGLQGIGKTTLARSIAEALGRPYIRIALGALGTTLELRGSPKSLIDSEPGQIVKAIEKTGVLNPVIVLDEMDKVSGEQGMRSDMMAVLLEVLDPEQNKAFRDHYLDYPLDISSVLFICTANNIGPISAALLDRLEIVRFSSYTDEEKEMIAKNYLLPKIYESSGLDSSQLEIEDGVWETIIRPLGFDAGIRQLERNMLYLGRKAARQIVSDHIQKVIITQENVKDYVDLNNIY